MTIKYTMFFARITHASIPLYSEYCTSTKIKKAKYRNTYVPLLIVSRKIVECVFFQEMTQTKRHMYIISWKRIIANGRDRNNIPHLYKHLLFIEQLVVLYFSLKTFLMSKMLIQTLMKLITYNIQLNVFILYVQ